MLSRRVCAILVLPLALVAGCSSDSGLSTPSASSSTAPSGSSSTDSATETTASTADESTTPAGGEVTAKSGGFTVTVPAGWESAIEKAENVPGIDLVVMNPTKEDGFSSNIVVTASEGDETTLESEIAKGKKEMEAAGRTIIDDVPTGQLDGETVKGFGSTVTQSGVDIKALSYGVVHDGRLYIVTASASAKADTAGDHISSILTSWKWK